MVGCPYEGVPVAQGGWGIPVPPKIAPVTPIRTFKQKRFLKSLIFARRAVFSREAILGYYSWRKIVSEGISAASRA